MYVSYTTAIAIFFHFSTLVTDLATGQIAASAYVAETVVETEKRLVRKGRELIEADKKRASIYLQPFERFLDNIAIPEKERPKGASRYDKHYYPLDTYASLHRLATKWPQFMDDLTDFLKNGTADINGTDSRDVITGHFDKYENGSRHYPMVTKWDLEQMETALLRIKTVYRISWNDLWRYADEETRREIGRKLDNIEQRRETDNSQTINLCRGPSKPMSESWHECYFSSKGLPYYRIKVEIVNVSPMVRLYHDFVFEKQRLGLIEAAIGKLEVSGLGVPLTLNASGEARLPNQRLSSQAWLHPRDYDQVDQLYKSVAYWSGLVTTVRKNRSVAELLQVVNYGLGGLFYAHHDYYDEKQWGPTKTHSALVGSGQRLATWMVYLTEPIIGGATVFPDLGYRIGPRRGSALVWDNLKPSGELDERSLHAGCAVGIGQKWIANLWIRSNGQMFTRPCPA